MTKRFFTKITFALFFLFLTPAIVLAGDTGDLQQEEGIIPKTIDYSNLQISEVLPNPTGTDSGNEWIEIHNTSEDNISLDNIVLQRIKVNTETNEIDIIGKFTIELETVIEQNEYLIFYPNFAITNSKCHLQIVDPENNVIDALEYNFANAIAENISLIRIEENIVQTSPTPGEENIYINLKFSLLDGESYEQTDFIKGETAYILDETKLYGLTNQDLKWFLDGILINSLEIPTADLSAEDHEIMVELRSESKSLIFTVTEKPEDFDGLEISEVFPNPEGTDITGENEWIEIYNASNREINLKGLVIERVTNSSIPPYTIEEDQLLVANEYFVFSPNFTLTNKTCNLRLLDANQNVINSFSYDESVDEGSSVIWYGNEVLLTTTPTPNLANILTVPDDEEVEPPPEDESDNPPDFSDTDFSQLEISEIFPNPEGKDLKGENEWVELYNTGSTQINLNGLILLQTTSRTYQYMIEEDLFLNAKSYILIYPDFSVNNSGATFQIQNGEETLFDEVYYDTAVKENHSLIRQDGTTKLITTSISTPKKSNILTGSILSTETMDDSSIEEAKQRPEDSSVKIAGTITVEPNTLGTDIFYIQDESGGIQIDLEGQDVSYLQKDTVIEVAGTVDIYHAETRIKVSADSITPLNQAKVIPPKVITIGEIDIGLIGSLLKIEGTVIKTSGNTFYVSDRSGTIKIQIKDTTGIERPECRKGYYAEIVGILSVWDENAEGEPNYRLLPRYQEDVFISKTLANTGGKNLPILTLGLILFLGCTGVLTCKYEKAKD